MWKPKRQGSTDVSKIAKEVPKIATEGSSSGGWAAGAPQMFKMAKEEWSPKNGHGGVGLQRLGCRGSTDVQNGQRGTESRKWPQRGRALEARLLGLHRCSKQPKRDRVSETTMEGSGSRGRAARVPWMFQWPRRDEVPKPPKLNGKLMKPWQFIKTLQTHPIFYLSLPLLFLITALISLIMGMREKEHVYGLTMGPANLLNC